MRLRNCGGWRSFSAAPKKGDKMTSGSPNILIIGAGPVGLTAALELARRGIASRIIDNNAPSPVNESRALAVNQRSMDLLAPSGVARLIDNEAIRLRQMQVFSGEKRILTIELGAGAGEQVFLRSLPQGRTERLLAARLAEFGIAPDWGVTFTGFSEPKAGKTVASLAGPKGLEEFEADIVIGADGAHSQVRKSLGLDFAGEGFPETFYIADIVYDRDIDRDHAQARFQNPGVIACIPVGKRTFRYISTLEDFKSRIQHPAEPVDIVWESTFKAVFRHVRSMQEGNVFLAGDAAHIHSPVGGRGMNLGIEDACWLAWLISEGRQADYTSLRMEAVEHVLAQTKANTRVILLRNPISVWLRNIFVPLALKVPAIRRSIVEGVRGLDTPAAPWLEHAP
jgi:2-polyprenyl-6-methoxyphenol hydroxylase-like FAD-dependent oxidoreductase